MNLTTKQALKHAFCSTRPASVCSCGHTGDGANSDHHGITVTVGALTAAPGHSDVTVGALTVAPGHGTCKKCPCMKFTWASWTLEFSATVG